MDLNPTKKPEAAFDETDIANVLRVMLVEDGTLRMAGGAWGVELGERRDRSPINSELVELIIAKGLVTREGDRAVLNENGLLLLRKLRNEMRRSVGEWVERWKQEQITC